MASGRKWLRRFALGTAAAVFGSCGPASSAAPTPTATATISPTAANLACKLPVFYPPATPDIQGGWATFPGGQTQPDSKASFTRSGSLLTSKARPQLVGDGPTFYDRAKTRWLPVGRKAVSDNGATYAYMDPGNALNPNHEIVRLVDVEMAHERTLGLFSLRPLETWSILDFTEGRIYLEKVGFEGPGDPGLWSLNPGTGQIQQLLNDRTPIAIHGQDVWFEVSNPVDGQAITDARTGDKLPDQVERRNLTTGATIPWLYRPGSIVELIGLDNSGNPFVSVSHSQAADAPMELWVVTAPNVASRIYQGTVADIDGLRVNFSDMHGTWFGGDRGVYLYSPGGSLRQVSSTGARPAGRCV